MQVHMPAQVLVPGVQHRGHPQFPAQAFRILSERLERAPGRLKEQPVELLRMQLHPAVQAMRQGEDQVVVADRQKVLLLTLGPAACGAALTLRAVSIAAR